MNVRIKNIFSRKHTLHTACAAVFALAFLIVGISFAFFSSSDKVSNEVNTKEYDIRIYEPKWSLTGSEAAKTSEPGETIDKDPYVYNNCAVDLYIRVKIEIVDSSGNALSAQAANAIAKALYITYDSSPLFANGSLVSSNSEKFYYDSSSAAVGDDYYYDGWFYYTADNTDTLAVLASKSATDKLFNYIHIPELKTQYEGVFDSEFEIAITAQALPTSLLSDTDLSSSLSTISKAFDDYQSSYKKSNI